MGLALQLAGRGLCSTRPNPRVGCVLVRGGEIVGQGWHQRAGEPHAEIHALEDAGERAAGATAYVTLEPCSHHGRTPPCVEALTAAGVRRVVTAMTDPNPRVAGEGLRRLADAGITVACGVLESEARALNPGFVSRMTRGRPWLRIKLAASLDGRTAMASGESKWITGEAARRDVHAWRARSCAVMTGIGTVLADDPALTVRDVPAGTTPAGQPLRVVLDSGLRLPAAARLLGQPGPVLVLTAGGDPAHRGALEAAGVEVRVLPAAGDGVDPEAVLAELARREINEVLVESGPTLAGALLRRGLVDELILYQAMHLLGDAARPLIRLPGLDAMADRLALRLRDVRRFGDDLRLILVPGGD